MENLLIIIFVQFCLIELQSDSIVALWHRRTAPPRGAIQPRRIKGLWQVNEKSHIDWQHGIIAWASVSFQALSAKFGLLKGFGYQHNDHLYQCR